jgi:DnaK suppressor protein
MHDSRSAINFPTVDTLQRDRFRKLLLEQRDQVTASMDGEDPAENQDLRDLEELATIIARTEVNDRIVEDDLHLVQKIDLALSRLEDGTYDQCANCGAEIPVARLLAKPSVSLCVPCQELEDAERRPAP